MGRTNEPDTSNATTVVDTDALKKAKEEAEALRAELEVMKKAKEEAEAEKAMAESRLEADVNRKEAENRRKLMQQRRVRIIIPSGSGEHERSPVFVGVNGYEYLIVRDKEVDVPEAVCNVLKDAKQTTYVSEGEGDHRRIVPKTSVRYSFQRLGYSDELPQIEEGGKA